MTKHARRTGVIGLAVAALLLSGVGSAQATDWDAVAAGKVGSLEVSMPNGGGAQAASMGECESAEPGQTMSDGAEIPNFLKFEGGKSTCSVNAASGAATAKVTGGRFLLTGLAAYGGPRIRLSSFTATCTGTESGSWARFTFGGFTGLSLPSRIPPNYTQNIRNAQGKVLAKVTLNKAEFPDPQDGSIKATMMSIKLFPNGPANRPQGTIALGEVECAPF